MDADALARFLSVSVGAGGSQGVTMAASRELRSDQLECLTGLGCKVWAGTDQEPTRMAAPRCRDAMIELGGHPGRFNAQGIGVITLRVGGHFEVDHHPQ